MTKELIHPALQKPITALDVSIEFKEMAKANGYKTLEDILKHPLHSFPFKRLSGYRMLKELIGILEANGLEKLIED